MLGNPTTQLLLWIPLLIYKMQRPEPELPSIAGNYPLLQGITH